MRKMSKFRRSTIGSQKNRNNIIEDDLGRVKVNNSRKIMPHGEFLNRIQRSLYYGKSKISIPLSDYIAESFSETHTGYSLNRLNYSTVGNLRSTPCSLILAMIYLERLKDTDPEYAKLVTPTELFLVSLMIATKFYSGHDDEAPYVNWVECANTTSDVLLEMELNFLTALDWKVYVSNEEFFNKVISLEIILSQKQGIRRGFYTYLEISNVMQFDNIVLITKQLIQSILVLSLSYTVLAATMMASVFLASNILNTPVNCGPQSTLENYQSDKIHVNPNETIQSIGYNLNDLDSRLYEFSNPLVLMHHVNPLLSSWYSFLNPYWLVITNNLDKNCDNDVQIRCNSTFDGLFNPTAQANTKSFKFDFAGLQITLA